jgi:hypothetical protein
VVGGREFGNYFSSYENMTKLKVYFEVTEEEISRYLIDTLDGVETNLEIMYSISSPRLDNSIDIVTSQPDYVKRWIIGLTVSPIKVNQPEASDVDFEMLVENVIVDKEVYTFPKEKVNLLGLRDREIQVEIDNMDELQRIVQDSIDRYGGEVKVEFKGRVKIHLLFLDTWLPFQVTRHTLVQVPHIRIMDTEWRKLDGSSVDTLSVNEGGYVLVNVVNPTRIHSLQEDFVCEFYVEGQEEPVSTVNKEFNVPPQIEGQYIFQFNFDDPGSYYYRVLSGEQEIVSLNESKILKVEQ